VAHAHADDGDMHRQVDKRICEHIARNSYYYLLHIIDYALFCKSDENPKTKPVHTLCSSHLNLKPKTKSNSKQAKNEIAVHDNAGFSDYMNQNKTAANASTTPNDHARLRSPPLTVTGATPVVTGPVIVAKVTTGLLITVPPVVKTLVEVTGTTLVVFVTGGIVVELLARVCVIGMLELAWVVGLIELEVTVIVVLLPELGGIVELEVMIVRDEVIDEAMLEARLVDDEDAGLWLSGYARQGMRRGYLR
jgi:hypothetical protein